MEVIFSPNGFACIIPNKIANKEPEIDAEIIFLDKISIHLHLFGTYVGRLQSYIILE
jgi:hypothetical protein